MHTDYLLEALAFAEQRRGFCAPNPSVGSVVVKQGKIIGKGFHYQCGAPHAEVMAISQAGTAAKGATVYVTLEPCCHYGRTPPCTKLLIEAGVAEVIYGYRDPNPVVAGKGESALLAAGISCRNVPIPEIDSFYVSYAKWVTTRRPFLTGKLALSLDGKIASHSGQPIQLTLSEASEFTHQQRKRSDAILTTVKTILNDDPLLNVRLSTMVEAKPVYVLDRQLRFPLTARVLNSAAKLILLHGDKAPIANMQAYADKGITCISLPETPEGLHLPAVVEKLGEAGLHDVWIEAGGKLMSSLLKQQLLQRVYFYSALTVLGDSGYTAFSDTFSLRDKATKILWSALGLDGLCQIDFGY